VLDTWLTPLKAVRRTHEAELKGIRDDSARAIRLAELNVEFGVNTLLSNYVVEEAVRDRGLKVHGILYDIACGKLRDLGFGTEFGGPPRENFEIVRGNHGMLTFGSGEAKMTIR
jgi:carbonic anhydrase